MMSDPLFVYLNVYVATLLLAQLSLFSAAFTVEGTKQRLDVVWPSTFHLLAFKARA